MATVASGFDVFLSHNGQDKPPVRQLAALLQERGLRVWLDEWELQPGLSWQQGLRAGLAVATSCAVLIGPTGFGGWHRREVEAALHKQGDSYPVIPVLLPGGPDGSSIDAFLSSLTWVDLRSGLDDPIAIDRLVWGITGRRTDRQPPVADRATITIDLPCDGDLLTRPVTVSGTGPPDTEVVLHMRWPGATFRAERPVVSDSSGRWAFPYFGASGGPGDRYDPDRPKQLEFYASDLDDAVRSQRVTVFYRDLSNIRRVADRVRAEHDRIEVRYELRSAFLERTSLQIGPGITSGRSAGAVADIESVAAAVGTAVGGALQALVTRKELAVDVTVDVDGRIHLSPGTASASYYTFPRGAEWLRPDSDRQTLMRMQHSQMAWRLYSDVGQIPSSPFGEDFRATEAYLEVRHPGYRSAFIPLDHGTALRQTVQLAPILQQRIAVLDFPASGSGGRVDGYSQLIAQDIMDAISRTPELAEYAHFANSEEGGITSNIGTWLGRPAIAIENEVLGLDDVRAIERQLASLDNPMVSGEGRHLQRRALDIQLVVQGGYRLL